MNGEFSAPHRNGLASAPESQLGRVVTNKTFAKPFRIVLMDGESRTRVFEVKTLAGLQSVVARVDKGELFEMGKFGAITMQLWGFLAEHVGFMTVATPRTMEAGLGILGPSAALVDDMADLCGGVDAGVEMLHEARRMAGVDTVTSKQHVTEDRQGGVVEVSDAMVEKAMEQSLAPEAEAAATDYQKHLAAQKARYTLHAQRTWDADQTAIARRKLLEQQAQTRATLQKELEKAVEDHDKLSGGEQAPETGLDEQGAP